MIRFKNKQTGDVIELSRVRTYINDDGSKINVDPTHKYDLSQYDEIRDEVDYKSINMKKAPNDRL